LKNSHEALRECWKKKGNDQANGAAGLRDKRGVWKKSWNAIREFDHGGKREV